MNSRVFCIANRTVTYNEKNSFKINLQNVKKSKKNQKCFRGLTLWWSKKVDLDNWSDEFR